MTTTGDVTLNVGNPDEHVHDWTSTGIFRETSDPASPIHALECADPSCNATGFGMGDFSDAARDARRHHEPSVWRKSGPVDPTTKLHPITNQFGEGNTCDCHTPRDVLGPDGRPTGQQEVVIDPGHEE